MKYFIKSKCWTAGEYWDDVELAEYDSKIKFAQHFEREFTTIEFDSELDALNKLREMFPDRLLTVLEDTGKVLSTWGHETGLTSMKIKRICNHD